MASAPGGSPQRRPSAAGRPGAAPGAVKRREPSGTPRTPPAPVIAVVVIVALPAVPILAFGIIGTFLDNKPLVPLWLLAAVYLAMIGSTAHGLWQGRRGARVVAIILGLMTLVGAVVIIVLLTAPASSRAWFTDDRASGRVTS